MKRVVLVLASALAANVATAQSDVTIYGIVDAAFGKNVGSDTLRVSNGQVSRIGFKGAEDIGGGVQAFFDVLMRFNIDTGQNNAGPRGPLWMGGSYVGLGNAYGKVMLGRATSIAALTSQIVPDPWYWDNVTSSFAFTTGNIGHAWYNNSITYVYDGHGIYAGAQVGEKADNDVYGAVTRRPFSLGAKYEVGPLTLGFGHESTGEGPAKWTTVNAGYFIGDTEIRGLVGNGADLNNNDVKSWYLSSTIPFNSLKLHLAYGQRKSSGTNTSAKASVGGYYWLSKRTSIYSNLAYDSKVANNKTGMEVGVKHFF